MLCGALGTLMVLRALGRAAGTLTEREGTWEDTGGTMVALWAILRVLGLDAGDMGVGREHPRMAAPLGQLGTLMGRNPTGEPQCQQLRVPPGMTWQRWPA